MKVAIKIASVYVSDAFISSSSTVVAYCSKSKNVAASKNGFRTEA